MIKFFKQSSEIFPIAVDYNDVLDDNENITKNTVSATIFIGGTGDATKSVIASSSNDNKNVIIKVKNGTNGLTYKITVVIETNATNIYEDDFLMEIINI